jgi:hypothetical protein
MFSNADIRDLLRTILTASQYGSVLLRVHEIIVCMRLEIGKENDLTRRSQSLRKSK